MITRGYLARVAKPRLVRMQGLTEEQILSCMRAWTWTAQRIPLVAPDGPTWRVETAQQPFGVTVTLTVYSSAEPEQSVRHILTAEMLRATNCHEVSQLINEIVAGLFRLAGIPVPVGYQGV